MQPHLRLLFLMPLLDCLYLNRLDSQLAPDWSLHAIIQREQWTVVTAPRPLPGEQHWVGGTDGFPTGSYAAGPWSQYGEQSAPRTEVTGLRALNFG